MISLDPQQQAARDWFESLRDRICAEFEKIEAEAGSEARFAYTPWDREADGLAPGEGGGGADLNPPIPYQEDTDAFHARFRAACAPYGPDIYERYAKWAEDYFYIPHRGVHRGVGGIFYDHLECGDDAEYDRNFAFTQAVGEAFLDIFPQIVRRRMGLPFTEAEREEQLVWRGRYAEFNLVYDRGTLFGLKPGGNVDAILMSLPPEAVWN